MQLGIRVAEVALARAHHAHDFDTWDAAGLGSHPWARAKPARKEGRAQLHARCSGLGSRQHPVYALGADLEEDRRAHSREALSKSSAPWPSCTAYEKPGAMQ